MENHSTYFLHCYVAGLLYYEVLEVWKKLEIGQEVPLLPESNNRYDAYAVAFEGKKRGYLPRGQHRVVWVNPSSGS